MIYNFGTLTVIKFFEIIKSGNLFLLLENRYRYNWLNKLKIKLFKIDLDKEWSNILKEYNDGEDDVKMKKIKSLKNKYEKLNAKYQSIIVTLEVLRYGSDDEMLDILKEHGYKLEKGETYKDGIIRIYKQTENLKNKIDGVAAEIEKYLNKEEGRKEINIYHILVNLTTQLGLSLETNKITLSEFTYYKKVLAKKLKQQNKK